MGSNRGTGTESKDRTERRGLGKIKVKGWNRKVIKAWKQKVVKMVYNTQVIWYYSHLGCHEILLLTHSESLNEF